MFESSLKIGSVFGIQILVHYTWAIVFILLSSSLYVSFIEYYSEWGQTILIITAVVTTSLFFISIVLHELGHSIVAIRYGIRVRAIVLFMFGGMAQTEKEPDSPGAEFWIAIAGPMVSLALALLFYGLYTLFRAINQPLAVICDWLASINFMVAIFNLIPGFPLDGGRVFRALVWGISGETTKGMRWAVVSGKVVAFCLMVLGLTVVLHSGQVFTGMWMLGIGWFLLAAAEASGQAFSINKLLGQLKVSEVMLHDIPYIEPDISLSDWINNKVLPTGKRAYLVRDQQQVVGLVTMSDCKKRPRDEWSSSAVSEIMTTTDRLHTVTPDTDLAEVLRNMGFHSFNQVPVVERGNVIGWIDRERIVKLIQSHNHHDLRR